MGKTVKTRRGKVTRQKTGTKNKKGTRKNPIRLEVRVPYDIFVSSAPTIQHVYDSLVPRYKKVKGGQYANIIIKRTEIIRGKRMFIPEGEFLVKRGKRKLSNKVVTQISKQVVVELNEKYGNLGTPEVFEEDLDEYIPDRQFDPAIEFEPTPEIRERERVRPPKYKGDRRFKVKWDYKSRRYRDRKGMFR